jgi:hypothetical protein
VTRRTITAFLLDWSTSEKPHSDPFAVFPSHRTGTVNLFGRHNEQEKTRKVSGAFKPQASTPKRNVLQNATNIIATVGPLNDAGRVQRAPDMSTTVDPIFECLEHRSAPACSPNWQLIVDMKCYNCANYAAGLEKTAHFRTCLLGYLPQKALRMPRYYFIIRKPNETDHDDPDGTDLPRDTDALDYANRIIRELKQGGGYGERGTAMIVKTDASRVVFIIPF